MIPTNIVQILDLVDTDDPILTGEGLFKGIELRTFDWEPRATHTILGLAMREEVVVVIVRHFIPMIY